MTALGEALRAVTDALEAAGAPYMLIGGLANLVWGIPRLTFDVDLTVWVEPKELPAFVRRLEKEFTALTPDPLGFIADTRVFPLKAGTVRVDLVFGQLPYEREAIRRAAPVDLAGKKVMVCTPEDMVVLKIVSDRPKDLEDLKGLVRRQGKKLDRSYLDPIVKDLARLLDRPDVWDKYAGLWHLI